MELLQSCAMPSIWSQSRAVLSVRPKPRKSTLWHEPLLKAASKLCLVHFYQTGSAQSMDQGSTMKRSAVHNFAPTVTTFCVMWEGQALPHDTKFGNSRCEIVGRRVIFIWSLIHGLRWSGLIKAEPDMQGEEYQARVDKELNQRKIWGNILYVWAFRFIQVQ